MAALEPFQLRVIEERDQLQERLSRLNAFLVSSQFYVTLDEHNQLLLTRQAAAMQEYLDILIERTSAF